MISCLVLGGQVTWAQRGAHAGSLRGKVMDAQGLQALPNAAARLLGSNDGVIADAQGIVELRDLPTGPQRLVVSYLGYASDTLLIDLQPDRLQTIDIYLEELRLEIQGVEISAGNPNGLAVIQRLDMQLRPVASAQELLRIVPGVFIAQHAGGGKAEQIFLRGFDIDHGTDLALSTDGMPVNMVSHAHGQGYADLHFLIPETVERLSVDKGPYTPKSGNLATAGSIDFQTRNSLDHNLVKLEGGMYNNFRALTMLKLDRAKGNSNQADAWVAAEYTFSKGYVESPQNLHRLNLFGKYCKAVSRRSLLTATLSDFRSQWNASGQIPERAVAAGLITRWGSIDPTEGGHTSRSNLNLKLMTNLNNGWVWRQQLYASRYTFDLYSNFTFFAHDSVHGDQIYQHERRWLSGYQTTLDKTMTLAGLPFTVNSGLGIRMDDIGSIGLDHTQQRDLIGTVQKGVVHERNAFAWAGGRWMLHPRWAVGGALRADYLHFGYLDLVEMPAGTRQAAKAMLSPKATVDFNLSQGVQLFVKAGSGFHSNDTRVVLGADAHRILPRAVGSDIGALFKPVDALLVQAAVWGLAMQQEFVYVGDEGIVEPSGRSRRVGVDVSARWQANRWLSADVDVNLAHARGLDDAGAATYIPLAPWITSTGGLNADLGALRGSLRYRYLGTRAADDTYSLVAKGYCLVDGAVSYTLHDHYIFGLSGQNLLNVKWKEAQFATTSRLRGESGPVTEIHYTPGTPMALKLSFTALF